MANGAVDAAKGRAVPTRGRGLLTPLSIIALFLTLSEAVLGVAATQTSGGVQVALTCFVILFPLMVAGAFFAILWRKPWVFYAPTDYAGSDMPRFVDALRGVTSAIQEGTKQLEAERQERMRVLQEQQLRLANRNEFQRLTLEINKLILLDPSLDEFYQREKREVVQVKLEALAYIYMNMYELIYEYYHSSELNEAEKAVWCTWEEMIRSTISDSPAFRAVVAKADSARIYFPGYFDYVKSLLPNQPNPAAPADLKAPLSGR